MDSKVPLNYQPHKRRRSRTLLYTLLAIAALIPVYPIYREMDRQYRIAHRHDDYNFIKCNANLRWIGNSLLVYHNEFGDPLPDTLIDLVRSEGLPPSALTCYDSTDELIVGPTTQGTYAELEKPGHVSYIYLGKGLSWKDVTRTTVFAYERLGNHPRHPGMNVALGDGQVIFLPPQAAKEILQQVADGVTQVRYPATQPSGR